MFKFVPLTFHQSDVSGVKRPRARSGHRIVCDHRNLYSYGGFNPSISETDPEMRNDPIWMHSQPLFKEIWKFNLVTQQWKLLPGSGNMPNELASTAIILKGNVLMIHGGTGIPFGDSCSNQLFVCNLDNAIMKLVPTIGDLPDPQYGQALICHGRYLYTVGGTTGYEYTCDIHRCDMRRGVWEAVYICNGRDQCEPSGRYRHELAFDGKLIYLLGGGTVMTTFGFSEIPAFNLETKRWMVLNTEGDSEDNSFPAPRHCHGSVQYTDDRTGITSVVISGGYDGRQMFSDVWRLNLSTLQWTCLRKCVLPRPVYFHSAALTPEGCMYTFGGIVREQNKILRTNAVHFVWLTIPKLSEMCWQALNYYRKDLLTKSPEVLRSLGIPLKFMQRID